MWNDGVLTNVLVILAAGFLAGTICRRFGISMLVGYLIVGGLLGHGGLEIVTGDLHQLQQIAEAGVLLLLFSIGLELSLDELHRMGRNLLLAGSIQMILTAIPVAVASMVLGMPWRPAILIGFATSLSSTVLVFKSLIEWDQVGTPHGRRALGMLLFQDAALVPLLLLIPLLTGKGDVVTPGQVGLLTLTSAVLVAGVFLLRRLVAQHIVRLLAHLRSPELVVLFTLVLLGGIALGVRKMGLPAAMGAFAAGLAMSGNRLTSQVDALILPFRESFAAIFFVSLGLMLDLRRLGLETWLILGGLIVVLVLKTFAAAVALRWTGLSWRSSLGMGIGLSQLGEFSFVLLLEGYHAKILTDIDYNRMLLFALGSLILTPQLLKYGLRWADRGEAREERTASPIREGLTAGVVIGLGPVGRQVASRLEISGYDVCLIDLSRVNLHPFSQQGFRTIVGDASDPTILEQAGIQRAAIAVVSVPDDRIALAIVRAIQSSKAACRILVRCRYLVNEPEMHRSGAAGVVTEESEASTALLKLLSGFPAAPASKA